MCDLPPEEEDYWALSDQRDKVNAELRGLVGENSSAQDHIAWYEGVTSRLECCASKSYYRRGFREGMRFIAEAIGYKK